MSKRVELIEKNGIIGKRCTKCNEWQPLENYHNSKTAKDGRKPRCKECCRIDKGAKKRIHRTEITEVNGVVGKECGICLKWIPLDSFLDRAKGLGGKRSDCAGCERKRNLEYFYANREKCRERERKWSENNPEKRLAKLRRWYENNPDKITENNHKRRARKLSLPDTFTQGDMDEMLNLFGGCALTGESEIHWDHVIPLSTGKVGTIRGNMIPLRKDLNMSKSDCNIFEWFEENQIRFNLDKNKFNNLIKELSEMNGMSIEDYRSFVCGCFNKQEVS